MIGHLRAGEWAARTSPRGVLDGHGRWGSRRTHPAVSGARRRVAVAGGWGSLGVCPISPPEGGATLPPSVGSPPAGAHPDELLTGGMSPARFHAQTGQSGTRQRSGGIGSRPSRRSRRKGSGVVGSGTYGPAGSAPVVGPGSGVAGGRTSPRGGVDGIARGPSAVAVAGDVPAGDKTGRTSRRGRCQACPGWRPPPSKRSVSIR